MKKLLFAMLFGLLVLSACGEDDAEGTDDDGIEEVDPADEGPTTDNADLIDDEGLYTDDPIEIVEDTDLETFGTDDDDYDITRYTSDDEQDDGFVHLEEEGFKIKFNIIYGGSENGGEDMIFVVGEQENTNEDGGDMQLGQHHIETSEGEQLEVGYGYDYVDGGTKQKVAAEFEPEYDKPDEIELHVDSVYDEDTDEILEDDDGGYMENEHEVDETFTFTKE